MTRLVLGLALSLSCACGDDDSGDGGGGDGGGDDSGSVDAGGADAGPPVVCDVPEVIVAGTPETDALAAAPARCGQAAHAWLSDPALGEVVAVNRPALRFTREIVEESVGAFGVTLPRPLPYEPDMRIVTYTTQDRGALVDATALVAFPRDLPSDAPPPDVILFLHGSSGYTDGCGPTHDLGSQVLAALLASYGYVAVAPDYLGLRGDGMPTGFPHPYLVAQPTAIASLDAVRAALRMSPSDRGNLCPTSRVLVVGGSQGGHAALFTDLLAPYYARELTIVGTVATVPPANLVAQMERALTELVPATGTTTLFFQLAPLWFGRDELVADAFVPPWDTDALAMITSECAPGSPLSPSTLEELFTPGILDAGQRGELLALGDLGCIAAESSMLHTSIARIPSPLASYAMLFVLAEVDPLLDSPTERPSVDALCADGVPVEYLECAGAGHLEGTAWSLGEILDFGAARFAGETPDPSSLCTLSAPTRCSGTP